MKKYLIRWTCGGKSVEAQSISKDDDSALFNALLLFASDITGEVESFELYDISGPVARRVA